MSQYFDSNPEVASKPRIVEFNIGDRKVSLYSDSGVFSKDNIDVGSLAFIKALLPLKLSGNILDLGCGYGPIGLSIALTSPDAYVTFADVNQRAVELCAKNAEKLGLGSRTKCLVSNVYENIQGKFDTILLNPPIRAGKNVTYSMYLGALDHLCQNGSLYIVIRKAQGAPSAAKYIEGIFGNITLLKKDKGYYVYKATKTM